MSTSINFFFKKYFIVLILGLVAPSILQAGDLDCKSALTEVTKSDSSGEKRLVIKLPEGTVIPDSGIRLFQVSEIDHLFTGIISFRKARNGLLVQRFAQGQSTPDWSISLKDEDVVITSPSEGGVDKFRLDAKTENVEIHFLGWGHNSSITITGPNINVNRNHVQSYSFSGWSVEEMK